MDTPKPHLSSDPPPPCKECSGKTISDGVLYSCPLQYQFKCIDCGAITKVEGEGIKTLSLEEAKKKRPEFYDSYGKWIIRDNW